MSVRVVVLPAFGEHASAWDALVRAEPEPNGFLLSGWLTAASDPRRVAIVAVFDGARLLGGLALERETRLGFTRYRIMGYRLSPDHVDLVAAAGETLVVIDALRQWFLRPGARVVEMVGVDDDARVLGALPPLGTVEPLDLNRIVALPESIEAYVASRSRSYRSSVSRERKRLAAMGVELGVVAPADLDAAIADLLRLHAELFGAASHLRAHATRFAAALKAAATQGDAALFEARLGAERVAVDAWSTVGPVWATLQGGRRDDVDLRGVGRALFLFGIEQAIASGAHTADLLRGRDQWKEGVSTETRELFVARAGTHRIATFGDRVSNRLEYEYRRRVHSRRRRTGGHEANVMEDVG